MNFAYTFIGIRTVPVPQNVSVGSSGGHPRVTWDQVPADDDDLIGYHVYRKIGSGSWDRLTNSPQSGTSYVDNTIEVSNRFQGIWVQYRVTSVIKNTGFLPDAESNPSVRKGIWGEPLREGFTQALPEYFALHSNYPNPFNPVTTIKYDLPRDSFVELKIYDLLGNEVATLVNGDVQAGYRGVMWTGRDSKGNLVPSGVYIYTINAISSRTDKDFHRADRMVLLR